jgi:hypothetical protein
VSVLKTAAIVSEVEKTPIQYINGIDEMFSVWGMTFEPASFAFEPAVGD